MFDPEIYDALVEDKGGVPLKSETQKKPLIDPQKKYLLIRFGDAYMNLFKWSPLVFLEANLKFLLSFLKTYLKPVYHFARHHYQMTVVKFFKYVIPPVLRFVKYKSENFVKYKFFHVLKMLVFGTLTWRLTPGDVFNVQVLFIS